MLGTIQLLLKHLFFIFHSFDDIHSERKKFFFIGDFHPLNM